MSDTTDSKTIIRQLVKKYLSGEELTSEEKAQLKEALGDRWEEIGDLVQGYVEDMKDKWQSEWQEHIEDPANDWIHSHIRTYTAIIAVAGIIVGAIVAHNWF